MNRVRERGGEAGNSVTTERERGCERARVRKREREKWQNKTRATRRRARESEIGSTCKRGRVNRVRERGRE